MGSDFQEILISDSLKKTIVILITYIDKVQEFRTLLGYLKSLITFLKMSLNENFAGISMMQEN